MKARQTFMDASITSAFNDFYKGFLTEDEIVDVVEGKDLWMNTEEVISRWKSKIIYLKGKV